MCLVTTAMTLVPLAFANASDGFKTGREALEITFQNLRAEATVGDALAGLRSSGIVSKSEVEKAKAFIESKNAMAAPLHITTDATKGTFHVGSSALATADGRLLGLTDDLGFSVLLERTFQRLTETAQFSKVDLFITPAQAEKKSMMDTMGALRSRRLRGLSFAC